MRRACAIVEIPAFADVQALPSFECFIDHELNRPTYLSKGLDSLTKQTTTQLHRRPTRPIEQVVICTKLGRLC